MHEVTESKAARCCANSVLAAVLSLALAVWLTAASGCGARDHISDDYGERTRALFSKQWVHRVAAEEPPQGLDSEESSIIQATYREDLGGGTCGKKQDDSARVLLLQEEVRRDEL